MARKKPVGWRGEPKRHAQAAQGIKTIKLKSAAQNKSTRLKGRWSDESWEADFAPMNVRKRIYAKTPRFQLLGTLVEMLDSQGQWAAYFELKYYRPEEGWDSYVIFRRTGFGKGYETVEEGKAAIDKEATKFLGGRTLAQAGREELEELERQKVVRAAIRRIPK